MRWSESAWDTWAAASSPGGLGGFLGFAGGVVVTFAVYQLGSDEGSRDEASRVAMILGGNQSYIRQHGDCGQAWETSSGIYHCCTRVVDHGAHTVAG